MRVSHHPYSDLCKRLYGFPQLHSGVPITTSCFASNKNSKLSISFSHKNAYTAIISDPNRLLDCWHCGNVSLSGLLDDLR